MRSFILGTSIFDLGIQMVKNCVQNIETYIIYIYIYIFFFLLLLFYIWVHGWQKMEGEMNLQF